MRVLILHSRYLSGWVSGENRVVADEARLLEEAGHQVRVLAPRPEDGGIRVSAGNGLRAIWSQSAIAKAKDIVEEFKPDIAHCHNLFPMLSPAILRSLAKRTTVVMTLHSYRMACLPSTFLRDGKICEACVGKVPWRGVRYRCYRNSFLGSGALAASLTVHRLAKSFDGVSLFLAVSHFLKHKHVVSGLPPHRILVKPNFSWETHRRSGPGDHFLYLGRLSHEKGVHVLLRAWRTIDAPLLVVGDGTARAHLQEMAPSHVRFLGSVSPEESTNLLRNARALILPSIWYEGAPRSIVESYASGVPVIGSSIGAIPEFVSDGSSGFLTSAGDPDSLANAVRRMLNDDTTLELGEGGHQVWRKQYTPAAGLSALESAYQLALETHA